MPVIPTRGNQILVETAESLAKDKAKTQKYNPAAALCGWVWTRVNVWEDFGEPLSKFRDGDLSVDVEAPMVHFQKYDRLKGVQNILCPGEHLQFKTLDVNLHKVQASK